MSNLPMKNKNKSLLLDSGAFSAWNKSIEIDIDIYIDFILQYNEYFDYVVNLDVIPGKPGIPPTKDQIEFSARKGYDNYYYMIGRGIPKEKLIHVFHQGEDFEWLNKMIAEMDYIGISPSNDKTTNQKIEWLDVVMDYIIDDRGFPRVKFHGFGVSSISILIRYPWYSVDSTSWVMTGRFGSIFVPKNKCGKYDYMSTPYKIDVSEKANSRNFEDCHLSNFLIREREKILEYIYEKGFTEEQLAKDYMKRDELNIIYFIDLEKNLPSWPWPLWNRKKNIH